MTWNTNFEAKEDYLFTPAFSLTAGNTYNFSFTYNGANTPDGNANEAIEILVSQGTTVADANAGTSIFAVTGVVQTGAFEDIETQASTGTGSFTPMTSGDYHFVFKSTGSPLLPEGATGFLVVFEYSVDETLSVDEFNGVDFTHFVDTQNKLNMSSNSPMSEVNIYNMLGQVVLSQKLSNQTEVVDIISLNSGVYLGNAQVGETTQTFKFIKK